MRAWVYRPDEVKNLLNPAFCGRVIYGTVAEYQKSTNRDMPFHLCWHRGSKGLRWETLC